MNARRWLRHRMVGAGFHLVRFLLGRIPSRWVVPIGSGFGRFAASLDRRRRKRAVMHLRAALGLDEGPAQGLALEVYRQLGRAAAEMVRPPGANSVTLRSDAQRTMDEVLAEGCGVVFVSAHFGSWELMARRLVQQGVRAAVVVRDPAHPGVARWLRGERQKAGLELIDRGSSDAPGRLRRALRQGVWLGVLLDQATELRAVQVPFFERSVRTPVGPARLALLARAPVLFGLIERDPRQVRRHVIRIERVPIPREGSLEARAHRLTAALTRRIESAIRERPDHWVWFHDRWGPPMT